MKKIAIFFIALIAIYIGANIFFSEKLNPSSLNIDNRIVKLPHKMHIKSIFGNRYEKREGFFGLTFAKDPYIIKYPEDKRIYIIVSNSEKNAIITLEPLLTTETLQDFSENNNSRILGSCLISDHLQRVYLIKNNHGYVIESDKYTLKEDLIKQFCFSRDDV